MSVYLYSGHFCSTRKAVRHGSHSFTCNYTNACLYLVSVQQMAPLQTEIADIKLQPITHLLPRDAMHKRGLCRHAVSVRLSVCVSVCHIVCLSRLYILSKRINISSKCFHHRVANLF